MVEFLQLIGTFESSLNELSIPVRSTTHKLEMRLINSWVSDILRLPYHRRRCSPNAYVLSGVPPTEIEMILLKNYWM